MFPLQIGDTTPYIILAVVALGVIMVVTIFFAQKKASTMSNDLSKQSHARFEALIPVGLNLAPTHLRIEDTAQPSTQHLKEPLPTNSSYLSLQKEVADLGTRLSTFILDYRERLMKEGEAQGRVDKIASEISNLSDRISKVEDLTSEIRTLKDEILSAQEELRSVKASLDEQNLKLKQLDVSKTRIAPTLASPMKAAPPQYSNGGGEAESFFAQVAATSPRRCVYCGFALDRQARFCGRCGRPAI